MMLGPCATTRSWTRSATRRWSASRGCRPRRACASGPSSKGRTRPARRRTGSRWRWSRPRRRAAQLTPDRTILEPTSRQHRDRAGDGGAPQGLRAHGRDPGQRERGADRPPAIVRRRDRVFGRREGHERLDRGRARARAGRALLHAVPVREPREPRRARARHRARDHPRPPRGHALRRGDGHRAGR